MPTPETLVALPFEVPYYAQVASPELASAFFGDQRPLESDPRWAETGAKTPAEYAYWANRACGIVCAKMLIEAFGGPVRPLMTWIQAGVDRGGYLVERSPADENVERGWLHAALAELIRPYAHSAWPEAAKPADILNHLQAGRAVIASVSYEIGTAHPITRKGGHLVVVTGGWHNGSGLTALRVHNPSGRTPQLRIQARIPLERFTAGYTGRVIVAQPRSSC